MISRSHGAAGALRTAAKAAGKRVAFAGLLLTASPGLAQPNASVAPLREPAVCARARAAQPEQPALAALADAESSAWKEAKAAQREAKKLQKSTLGMGASMASVRATARVAELDDRYGAALDRARTICGCRQALDDPHREDCNAQYARWLPPRPAPEAP